MATKHRDAIHIFDVLVIGGGPSGMMAAGRAAELGADVLLVEKNDSLGKKLLITGGGRCNVTNAELDTRKLLNKFKDGGKYLFSAFSQWGVSNTLDFFHIRNMGTKIEHEKRVFPVTNKAQSVWDVLVENMKRHNVTVLSNTTVSGFILDEDEKTGKKSIKGVKIKRSGSKVGVQGGNVQEGVALKGAELNTILAREIILATGGTSRPETGSTGDGYAWLQSIGHTVITPKPSLVPIAGKDLWIKRLAGVSLPDVKITSFQNGQKQDVQKGKILFTHVGISGPTILNMSKDVGELLKYGEVILSIDVLPSLDHGMLNTRLQELFKENDKKKFKNSLSPLVGSAISPIIIELSGIDGDKQCNSITREERLTLIQLIKGIPIHVDKLLGEDKAIISSGGVTLDEVDFKTMQSRLFENLYLVGDILHIDRPSGGYSLQLCWTTGFVAGTNAAQNTKI